MTININVRKNGPFIVDGDLDELNILDQDGNAFEYKPVEMGGKQLVILCRCGASVNKPFCDGTHGKIGFKAAESAVAES